MAQVFSLGGIGAPCCCGGSCCLTVCAPCKLPQKDLLLTYTNLLSGGGTTALTYSPTTNSWKSACSNGLEYYLFCTGGNIELRATYFTAGSCPGGTQQYCSNLRATPFGLTLSASQCAPLSLKFDCRSAGCPTLTTSGYTEFVVSDPSPVGSPGLMCQLFYVDCCSGTLQGATVNVYASLGGALVASGTTNTAYGSLFGIYLWWQGSPGTYYVQVVPNNGYFQTYASSKTLACSGQTVLQLSPATGYDCCSGCCDPVPSSLNFTDSLLGISGTATYQTTGLFAGSWTYSQTVTYPNATPCGAGSIAVTWVLNCGGSGSQVSIVFGVTGNCPDPTASPHIFTVPVGGTFVCPPTFSFSVTFSPFTSFGFPAATLYGISWSCSPCPNTTITFSS